MKCKMHLDGAPWGFVEREAACAVALLDEWLKLAATNGWRACGFFILAGETWIEVTRNGETIH